MTHEELFKRCATRITEYVSVSLATVELDATNVSPVTGVIQIVNRVIAAMLAVHQVSVHQTENALVLPISPEELVINAVLAIINIQNA